MVNSPGAVSTVQWELPIAVVANPARKLGVFVKTPPRTHIETVTHERAEEATPKFGGKDWGVHMVPLSVVTNRTESSWLVTELKCQPSAMHEVGVGQEMLWNPSTPAGTDWLVQVAPPSDVAAMTGRPGNGATG